MQKSHFLIGASSSGSGKTTFTLGILRALRNRGLSVQPFKCGPDYLDPKHHAAAAGQVSYNLDSFMATSEHIQEMYTRLGINADICITEGVMGLFDGYDHMSGSSAEIAKILQLPIILVINAKSTAYSVAAILYGFKHFCPDIHIAGAIFNFVGSESHYTYLKQACEDTGIEALGYLPKCKDIEIPSRHLGLTIDNTFCFDEFADRIANQIEKTVNLDRLLEICSLEIPAYKTPHTDKISSITLDISIARDEAFNFTYPENIRILERMGKITYFSPLQDQKLPDSDLVYLPGGYPEFYLKELSGNVNMRQSILDYCLKGGYLLAECGGMMYLGEYITDPEGHSFPMCGYLPQGATMENMKLKLGYRKVFFQDQEYRGHEFHYSRIVPGSAALPSIARVTNAQGIEVDTPVYRLGNVIASYIHFYWAENNPLLQQINENNQNNRT